MLVQRTVTGETPHVVRCRRGTAHRLRGRDTRNSRPRRRRPRRPVGVRRRATEREGEVLAAGPWRGRARRRPVPGRGQAELERDRRAPAGDAGARRRRPGP
ncbi:hypothetical protein F1C76_02005 [Geodermatophilaceae bacterium NBWT11]|nr:hypothetical protein F1C76_02005 [Geodermatophilaceae bacterium NBWT11]